MAMANDPALSKTMRMLRCHGITREPEDFINESDGPWYYEQQMLGFNYRMTDIQAALGLSQMANLETWILKRGELARHYFEALAPEVLPRYFSSERRSAFHLYVHRIAPEKRSTHFHYLRQQGIAANVHYIPIYKQPWYQKLSLMNAEIFYSSALTLPLYVTLSHEEQLKIISTLLFYKKQRSK